MKRFISVFSALILVSGLQMLPVPVHAAPIANPFAAKGSFEDGVTAYRNSEFSKASKIFDTVVRQHPENVDARYYLAISLTRIGRYEDARKIYLDVIRISPNSESGVLAKQGLSYLPKPNELDAPPKVAPHQAASQALPVSQPMTAPGQMVHDQVSALKANAPVNPAATVVPAAKPAGGMDMQTLQMMMMMGAMGGGGGGGGGMGNMMMMPMMQSLMQGQNGAQPGGDDSFKMSPDMMRSMMMNQMMQNNDGMFGGSNKDD